MHPIGHRQSIGKGADCVGQAGQGEKEPPKKDRGDQQQQRKLDRLALGARKQRDQDAPPQARRGHQGQGQHKKKRVPQHGHLDDQHQQPAAQRADDHSQQGIAQELAREDLPGSNGRDAKQLVRAQQPLTDHGQRTKGQRHVLEQQSQHSRRVKAQVIGLTRRHVLDFGPDRSNQHLIGNRRYQACDVLHLDQRFSHLENLPQDSARLQPGVVQKLP